MSVQQIKGLSKIDIKRIDCFDLDGIFKKETFNVSFLHFLREGIQLIAGLKYI